VLAYEHGLVGCLVNAAYKTPIQNVPDTRMIRTKRYRDNWLHRGSRQGSMHPDQGSFNILRATNSFCHSSMDITHRLDIQGCTWYVVEAFGKH
jgi:hypothetical protein